MASTPTPAASKNGRPSLAGDPARVHLAGSAGTDDVERSVQRGRDPEAARHVVEAAHGQDAERRVRMVDQRRRHPGDRPVAAGHHHVAAVVGGDSGERARIVILPQDVEADVEPPLAERRRERIRLEPLRVVVKAGTGARLASGNRVHQEQDGPPRHSVPR